MSETVTETAEAPPLHDDIKSDIRAAIAAKAVEPTERPEATPSSTEPTDDAAPASQPRRPDGKFASKDAAEPTQAAPTDQPTETAPAAPAAVPDDLAKATAQWTNADRTMLQSLPQQAQEFVLRRHREMQADYTKKTTALADFRRDYDPIEQMFAPYKPQMAQAGLTPAAMVKAWHDVEQDLMQGRGPQVISRIVQTYRIPPAEVAQALGIRAATSHAAADPAQPVPEGGQTQPTIPPELMQVLNQYGERITAHEQLLTRQQQAAQQQAANRVMSAIETFASETDKAGALLHPHFHELEDDMVRLAHVARASGMEPDLSKIYEQAVWANTSTREKMLGDMQAATQAQQAQAEQQKRTEARAKAEQAKRAGSSVTGAPGAGQIPGRGNPQTLRDEIASVAREVLSAA